MIIRYLSIGLLFLVAKIIGYLITPINYYIKDWLRTFDVTWWFLNDTVAISDADIDWGDYGRFAHNFVGFYQQNALRNSHWNLKLLIAPKKGEKTDVEGELELLSERWYFKVGSTSATYKVGGTKYFRKSMIKKVWSKHLHYQMGCNDVRYLYKVKIF